MAFPVSPKSTLTRARPLHVQVLFLHCVGTDGLPLRSLRGEDVTLTSPSHPSGVRLVDVSIIDTACARVVYTVAPEGITDVITAQISVQGERVAGCPMTLRPVTRAAGKHVGTLHLALQSYNHGLAVSLDGTRMAVSNWNSHSVSLYRLSEGERAAVDLAVVFGV